MRFLKAAVPELDLEQRQILYRLMNDFVQAGGVVTLTEWESMSADEKAMLIEIRKGGPGREAEILEAVADRLEKRAGASEPLERVRA